MVPLTGPASQAHRARVALVGLGAISQSVHLPLLARRWDLFEVVALADLSATRVAALADRYGVAGRFTRLEELLVAHATGELTLDGVIMATSGSHGGDALAVVEAGLPLLCEKPLAFSRQEITAIDAVPDARVHIGYMKEHDPATLRARTVLADTRPRAVTVEVLHPSTPAQLGFARLLPPVDDIDAESQQSLSARTEAVIDSAVGAGTAPRWRDAYANVVLGSLVHNISLLRHLTGGIEQVDTAEQWGDQNGDPGSFAVTGTLAGGARLQLGWHYLPDYPDYRETVTFHHETGSVSLVFGVPYLLNGSTRLELVTWAGDGEGMAHSVHTWNQQEAFENELAAFHQMVTTGAASSPGPREGMADLLVAQQVLAALARRHGFAVGGEVSAG